MVGTGFNQPHQCTHKSYKSSVEIAASNNYEPLPFIVSLFIQTSMVFFNSRNRHLEGFCYIKLRFNLLVGSKRCFNDITDEFSHQCKKAQSYKSPASVKAEIPDSDLISRSQTCCTPTPRHVTKPIPVTTTLRLSPASLW